MWTSFSASVAPMTMVTTCAAPAPSLISSTSARSVTRLLREAMRPEIEIASNGDDCTLLLVELDEAPK